ncbi:hypothetical protein, partial [Streptomyces labedae]|uniref:hypothetical protein n=1 Tax=Streptomyces labedae TaxID=285569 RepID=UPI0031F8F067
HPRTQDHHETPLGNDRSSIFVTSRRSGPFCFVISVCVSLKLLRQKALTLTVRTFHVFVFLVNRLAVRVSDEFYHTHFVCGTQMIFHAFLPWLPLVRKVNIYSHALLSSPPSALM